MNSFRSLARSANDLVGFTLAERRLIQLFSSSNPPEIDASVENSNFAFLSGDITVARLYSYRHFQQVAMACQKA